AGTGRPIPSWLQRDPEMLSGQVVGWPSPGDLDVTIAPQLVVEFYSR
ncbi:MAG: 30S ribosomal protein S4, partial [Chloroflexi bacterium]|nr:30S ribosomal protein S4 [Chloroflexota bacterium]